MNAPHPPRLIKTLDIKTPDIKTLDEKSQTMTTRTSPRQAFTLVEILVVIAILGILMGIAIPAINSAVKTANNAAIKMETYSIAKSVDTYFEEYGDYPPDFSDWNVVERHFRKTFPRIHDDELRILAQFTHVNAAGTRINTATTGSQDPRTRTDYDHYPHAIDRAEAMVFCLGGLSKDVQRPFTGVGGPLALRTDAGLVDPYTDPAMDDYDDFLRYQCNTDRGTGSVMSDTANLSVAVYTTGTNPLGLTGTYKTYAYSTEDGVNSLSFTSLVDPFPAFVSQLTEGTLAYFDSRTYDAAFGISYTTNPVWYQPGTPTTTVASVNLYAPVGAIEEVGVARPMTVNVMDTTPPTVISGFAVTGPVLEFANKGTYQIISPGRDGNFGGTISNNSTGAGTTGVSVYPSGAAYNPFRTFSPASTFGTSISSVARYQDDEMLKIHYAGSAIYGGNPQLDNVTNFSESIFESELP